MNKDSELIFEAYTDSQKKGIPLRQQMPSGGRAREEWRKKQEQAGPAGADPQHIQRVIDFYTKGPPEEKRIENDWHRIAGPQFHDMAAGGRGEKSEFNDTRSQFYNDWKNEDFQAVIDAIEGENI